MAGTCDVFFSYHTVDHATVTQVAQRLHDRGIRVFLDRWYLAGGQPWQPELERMLASCGAVAVFLGAEGLGPWQQRERDLALDRQGRELGFPVIPVLLSRTDPPLGFLKLNTWIDLSAGAADNMALEILTAAIRRQPPGPLALQQITAVLAEVCPYRGLRPFREEDEPFFFGRAAFTETLATTLARQSFVAVVGASGSGKSSVVRAGMIPRLRRGEGGRIWEAVSFVPTDQPLHSLAKSLLQLLEPDLTEVDRLAEVGKLARHLVEGDVRLRDVTSRILEKQPGTERLLLFADQWEELYTLCTDEAIRTAFVAQLLEVVRSAEVTLVLTLRGDFMGHVLAHRELSDRLQDSIVTIGPMTRNELAETITKPAEKMGLAFEPGLVETILDDVGAPVCVAEGQEELKIGEHEPGNLPLLEFLLEALWKERRGNLLHYDAYHRLGRVSGAIAHRAEEVFQHKLTEAERQAAQQLLIRMVRPGEGIENTRQRAAIPVADPVAETTIRKLADARLVVTEQDAASGRETVEVAHEALIRSWQRLRGWVDQDRKFLHTRERIAAQARLWEYESKPPYRLLPPGLPLAEGEDLLATRSADLDADLITYIEESATAAKAQEDAKRAVQRRRLHKARLVAAAMGLLALVAIGGGTIAWWQRGEANRNSEQARAAQDEAERSLTYAINSVDTLGTGVARRLRRVAGIKGLTAEAVHETLTDTEQNMKSIVAVAPDSPEVQNRLALMHIEFARTYDTLGDHKKQMEQAQEANRILVRFVRPNSPKSTWRRDLGVSYCELGNARYNQGDLAGALDAYDHGIPLIEGLRPEDPTNAQVHRDLLACYAIKSSVLYHKGDLQGADIVWRSLKPLLDGLVSNASSGFEKLGFQSGGQSFQFTQEIAQWSHTGNNDTLLKALAVRREIIEGLYKQDVSNPQRQYALADALITTGTFYHILEHNLDEALQAYRDAEDILERLIEQDHTNTKWQSRLADVHDGMGDLLAVQSDSNGALEAYGRARTIIERLAKQDPSYTDWQVALAGNHSDVGVVLSSLNDTTGALTAFRNAQQIMISVTRQEPSSFVWQHTLMSIYEYIGNILVFTHDYEGALTEYYTAKRIAEEIGLSRQLASVLQRIGHIKNQQGDATTALEFFQTARTLLEQIEKTGRNDRFLPQALMGTQNVIGDILRERGQLDDALIFYRRSIAIMHESTAENPEDRTRLAGVLDLMQAELVKSHNGVGRVLKAQGNRAGALEAYRTSAAIAQSLMEQGLRKDMWRSFLASIYIDVGPLLTEQGDRAGALEAFRKVEAIYKHNVAREPMDLNSAFGLALVQVPIANLLWEDGDHDGALAAVRQSVALLKQQSSSVDNNQSLASALGALSWYCLLKQDFNEAKAAASEGYSLDQQLWVLINYAHAEMFLGNAETAISVHRQNRNSEIVKDGTVKGWKVIVQEDFAAFKKAGLVSQHMAYIESMLERE